MVHLQSLRHGLAKTISITKGKKGRNDAEKEATRKNNEVVMMSSPISVRSDNFAYVCSKRGEKGINQDCFTILEEFGCEEDMIFCGVFDGHGPWGHKVAQRVAKSLPPYLLSKWNESLATKSAQDGLHWFNIWKQTYMKTYDAIDQELKHHPRIDSFRSGTTASTIIKQGARFVIANVGDSRAILGTTSDNGKLVPIQLTVDFKPNLPQEAERILQSKGRVFSLNDEPGVYRMWMPNEQTQGLALSRAFGDYCFKDYGLISVPSVTQRNITSNDQFLILATDGVWDVISNQEAVEIVSLVKDREKSAKRLVECAARAWKRKKRGIAMDDISAICLFFHGPP